MKKTIELLNEATTEIRTLRRENEILRAKLNVSDLRIAEELGNGNDYFCTITATQMQRASRKLCGMMDCTCGTVRGPQEHNGRKLIVMHETQHGLVQV